MEEVYFPGIGQLSFNFFGKYVYTDKDTCMEMFLRIRIGNLLVKAVV